MTDQVGKLRHHPQRGLAAMDALHVVECIAKTGDVVVPGRTCEMRGQQYVVELEQRIVWGRRLLVPAICSVLIAVGLWAFVKLVLLALRML